MFLSHHTNQFLGYLAHPRLINSLLKTTTPQCLSNLNGADAGRRLLRIDLAGPDPFLEGKTTVRGELIDFCGLNNKWSQEKDYREDRRQGSASSAPSRCPNSTWLNSPGYNQSKSRIHGAFSIARSSRQDEGVHETNRALRDISGIILRPDFQLCALFLLSRNRHSLLSS